MAAHGVSRTLATSPTRSLGDAHSLESQLSVTSTTFIDECASSYSSQGRRGSPLRGTVAGKQVAWGVLSEEHVTLKERKSALHHWRNKELPARPVKTDEPLTPPLTLATMAQPKKVVNLYRSLQVPLDAWEDLAEASLPKSPVSAMADFSSDAAVVDEDEIASAPSDDLDGDLYAGDLDVQNVELSNGTWPQLTPYRTPGFGTHFGLGEETPTTPWGLSPEQPRRIPHKIAARLGGFRDDKGPLVDEAPAACNAACNPARLVPPSLKAESPSLAMPPTRVESSPSPKYGKSSPSPKSVDEGREAPAMAPAAYVCATWTHWRADVDAAFARTDTNGDGKISRTELVRACRLDDGMRALLGLPVQIQLEDGTRDAFERLFGRLEEDSKKVRRDAVALVASTITLDAFRAILAPELLRAHHASSRVAAEQIRSSSDSQMRSSSDSQMRSSSDSQMRSSSDGRHETPGHQTPGHPTPTHETSGQAEYPWGFVKGFVPLPGRLLPSSTPNTRPPPPPSRSAVVEACCSPHVTTPADLRSVATLEAARRHWRPLVPFAPPVTFGRTQLHYLDRAREAARSGCDRVEVAIEAISRLTPAHLGAIEHLYMLLVECRHACRHGSPSTASAALSESEWRHFCMHFLRQPSSFEMLLPMTLLISLHQRFERRCAHAAAQAEPGSTRYTRYRSSDGSNALAPSAVSAGVVSAGVGAFIGLLCEVADHWARRNGLAPEEMDVSLAGSAPGTAPDLGLFEAIRVKLRLPPGLPALHYLLDRIAIASDHESENGGDAVKRSQRHAIIHAIRRQAGQRLVQCTSLDRALEPLRLWPVAA